MREPLKIDFMQLGEWAGNGLRLMIAGGLGLALLTSAGFAQGGATASATHRKVRKTPAIPAPIVAPVPEVVTPPPPPPPPPTPGEMPPNPPTVTFYEDGELSIVAENSTLASILSAVGATTGANVDLPAGLGADRVWIRVGPGPARSILAALLVGTDLDYIIQSSDSDETRIQNVMLTRRSKGPKGADATQSYASRMGNRQFGTRSDAGLQNSDSSASSDSSAVAADADGSGGSGGGQPAGAPTTQADAQSGAPATSASLDAPSAALTARLPLTISEADAHPTPVANPEQAIPQMQNLFELRKQLQQQMNAQQKAAGSR